jgi:alpha-beta hydrolase superfamily lysophospholipase
MGAAWSGRRLVLTALLALAGAAGGLAVAVPRLAPPDWGARAIVHPYRKPVTRRPGPGFELVRFESRGVRLEGWLFRARAPRGTVVYLHGLGDNRESGIGAADRLVPRGFSVLAFDGRAHGLSGGDTCSYGYHERDDVREALDAVRAREAVLLGHSLGAAVALQAAAVDPRVRGVVAASSFSDLRTIVEQRAAWLHVPAAYVARAIARAGQLGGFPPEEASPVALAPRVRAPVLLLHGAEDWRTPPSHSLRIAAALGGPHELRLLDGVGHDEILGRDEAWREIERFLDRLYPAPAPGP